LIFPPIEKDNYFDSKKTNNKKPEYYLWFEHPCVASA